LEAALEALLLAEAAFLAAFDADLAAVAALDTETDLAAEAARDAALDACFAAVFALDAATAAPRAAAFFIVRATLFERRADLLTERERERLAIVYTSLRKK
jgi:hypothetical protein